MNCRIINGLFAVAGLTVLGWATHARAQANPVQLNNTPQIASPTAATVVAVQQPNGPLSNLRLDALKAYVNSGINFGSPTITGTLTGPDLSTWTAAGLALQAGKLLCWNGDVGFSRDAAGDLAVGSCSQGSLTGGLDLATVTFQANANISQVSSGVLQVGTGSTHGANGSLNLANLNASGAVSAGSLSFPAWPFVWSSPTSQFGWATKAYTSSTTFVNAYQNILAFGDHTINPSVHTSTSCGTGSISVFCGDEVAFGDYTLSADVTGRDNTAIGDHALSSLISGSQNTMVGSSAGANLLSSNVSGLGTSACQNLTVTTGPIGCFGVSALQNAGALSQYSDCFGFQCFFHASDVEFSAGIGDGGFYNATSIINSVALGFDACANPTSVNNVICIGQQAGPTSSAALANTLWIGGASPLMEGNFSTNAVTLSGAVTIGGSLTTSSLTGYLYGNGSGAATASSSIPLSVLSGAGTGVLTAAANAVNTSSGFLTGSSAASAFDVSGAAAAAQAAAISTAEAYSAVASNLLSGTVPSPRINGTYSGLTLSSSQVTGGLGYTPPTPTGSGASGTWGISITGNAASATTASAAPLSGLTGAGTGVLTAAANAVNTSSGFLTGSSAASAFDVSGAAAAAQAAAISTAEAYSAVASNLLSGTVPSPRINGTYSGLTLSSSQVTGGLGYTPPTPTGSGASGTWGISITGNAASATTASAAPLSGLTGAGTGVLTAAANAVNTSSGFLTGSSAASAFDVSGAAAAAQAAAISTAEAYSAVASNLLSGTVPSPRINGTYSGLTLSSSQVTGGLGYTPPTPTGSGASGTWGISITGNAASATTASAAPLSGLTGAGTGVLTAAANAVNTTGGFATSGGAFSLASATGLTAGQINTALGFTAANPSALCLLSGGSNCTMTGTIVGNASTYSSPAFSTSNVYGGATTTLELFNDGAAHIESINSSLFFNADSGSATSFGSGLVSFGGNVRVTGDVSSDSASLGDPTTPLNFPGLTTGDTIYLKGSGGPTSADTVFSIYKNGTGQYTVTFNAIPTVNGVPIGTSSYAAGTCLSLSGTTFNLASSCSLPGTPTAATAATSTNTTQLATTAYVQNNLTGTLSAAGYSAGAMATSTITGYGFSNNNGPSIYVNGTAATGLGSPGALLFYTPSSGPVTSMASSGVWSFPSRPTFNGATPWDSANLPSPLSTTTAAATYAPISSLSSYATLLNPTFTGTLTAPDASSWGVAGVNMAVGKLLCWNGDVGFSRDAAGDLAVGACSQGSLTGGLDLATLTFQANANISQVASGVLQIGTGSTHGANGSLNLANINASAAVNGDAGNFSDSVSPLNFTGLVTGGVAYLHGSGGSGDNMVTIQKIATANYNWIFPGNVNSVNAAISGLLTLSGTSYTSGSTNTQGCAVFGDGNSPTANDCHLISTTASGNKSQIGLAVSLTSNAVSTSGAEAVTAYFANLCESGAPKCWALATAQQLVSGSSGGVGEEIVLTNGNCDPGVPWAPSSSCMPTAGASSLLIDSIGNSTSGVSPNEAAIYIVNATAGTAFHAGIMMASNTGGSSGISDAGVADYTQDSAVLRVGNSHAHFYAPETSGLAASYSGTMWFGELTVGNSAASGPMLSLANSAGTCTLTPTSGSATFSCSSDARLKTDYGPDGDELAYINSLPIDRYKINATGEITVGAIAQKLQTVHPEMVHEVEDDLVPADKENAAGTMLSADQPNIWRLTRGIQQVWAHDLAQDAEIADLKAQIATLRSGARLSPANDNSVFGVFHWLRNH